MFVTVNQGHDPASCQEDYPTFMGLRKAQFAAWPSAALDSYFTDLEEAKREKRNLIEAKYIHMMKTTEPSKYDALLPRVKMPSDESSALAHEVSDILLEQTRLLYEDYPYVSGQGRPLYSTFDYAAVSIETYQLGELLTYSENTLSILKEYIKELRQEGVWLARAILENSVSFYGYDSLETAEAAMKERAEKMGIQFSFGCSAEDGC